MQKMIDKQEPYISRYTKNLLVKAKSKFGVDSSEYKGIFNQYFKMPQDTGIADSSRHFHAELDVAFPKGLERFYRRVTVIDLLTKCASECSFCCRGYYNNMALKREDIDKIAVFLAEEKELREVLITGGDPLIAPKKLKELLGTIVENAPNIKMLRMGTRLPVQSPEKVNAELYDFFSSISNKVNVEIAIQINHPFELQPEAIAVIKNLQKVGVRIYSQNVLLKNVNDKLPILIELYDKLRYLNIVPYYFYHALPIKGTDEFRTSVSKGLELIGGLTSSGLISGMAKPMFTIMTDVGKVTLYHNSIIGRNENYLLIKTNYTIAQRRKWNPGYQLPSSAIENEDGTISVYYLDGSDD